MRRPELRELHHELSRRDLLRLAGVGLSGLGLAAIAGCGSGTQQVVVSPMTPEAEVAFENGVDFIDDPSLLEGSWLDNWESDIEHRVTLADVIAIVRITTVRRDTDLERHDTYHLAVAIESVRLGTPADEVSLTARQGQTGFGTLVGNDERLLTPPADHPNRFLLFLRWARTDGGATVARWHLSPAGASVVQRANSLIEMRRTHGSDRRRITVHTTTETDESSSDQLLLLLRRFAMESAREEARLFCDELANDTIAPSRFARAAA